MNASLVEHIRALPQHERDAAARNRFREGDSLAEQLGVSLPELQEAIRACSNRSTCNRFAWLEAFNRNFGGFGSRLRVAVAIFSHAGDHGYLWPSQKTLALKAGYGDSPNAIREVRRALTDMARAGCIRKVRLKDFPAELSDKALGATKSGGSGRTPRGIGYALVPPEKWPDGSAIGGDSPSINRGTVPLYNHKGKPEPSSPDSLSSRKGANQQTSNPVVAASESIDGGQE